MMKWIILVFTLVVFLRGYGQNNQIRLYIQQIAANKVYIEYLQKGYKIVRGGLNSIGAIKDGHLSLDIRFFDGLEHIHPAVSHYSKVVDIASLNARVVTSINQLIQQLGSSELFGERDAGYIVRVSEALLNDCLTVTEELSSLLKTSELKMSDDQRIKRLDRLHGQMQDNYGFTRFFLQELKILQLQHSKEARDVKVLGGLTGLDQ